MLATADPTYVQTCPPFKSSVTEVTVPESLLGKLQYVH